MLPLWWLTTIRKLLTDFVFVIALCGFSVLWCIRVCCFSMIEFCFDLEKQLCCQRWCFCLQQQRLCNSFLVEERSARKLLLLWTCNCVGACLMKLHMKKEFWWKSFCFLLSLWGFVRQNLYWNHHQWRAVWLTYYSNATHHNLDLLNMVWLSLQYEPWNFTLLLIYCWILYSCCLRVNWWTQ